MRRILFLFLALLPLPGLAAEATDLNFTGTYEFRWNIIPFGKLELEAKEDGKQYSLTTRISLTGLAKMFNPHQSTTTAVKTAQGLDYATDYRIKKKQKAVRMTYDASGHLTSQELTPPEPEGKRPAVDQELKDNSFDPLSGMLAIRHAYLEARGSGKKSFSLNIYDGRRVNEVTFQLLGLTTLNHHGNKVEAYEVTAKRKAIAGFNEEELSETDPNEPAARLYFSDDSTAMPLKLSASVMIGTVSAVLE